MSKITQEDKFHLSLVVAGHVDAGKSTTVGHLIFNLGGISDREMRKLQSEADKQGKSSFGFAYFFDTNKEERERGLTIKANTKDFYTEKYHYSVVDAPGHKDYIKNMITGSSTADVGLLLVPAEKGGFEAAIAKADPKMGIEEGQTRQHARLLYLLGVEQLIVGVNKMDATMPPWSEERFNEIKVEFCTMLHTIGYKPKKVPFIPYSGFDGDNLDTKTDKAPWYKGWAANINPKTTVTGYTLLECLNNFIQPPKRLPDAPLRMPVSDIYHIKGVGTIVAGRVEQGTLRPGDVVGFVPVGLDNKKVFSIEEHHKSLPFAGPGDSIGISIKGLGKDEHVNPGDIMFLEKEGMLNPVKEFTAFVQVQEHPGVLKPGYCPLVFSRTAKVPCKMTKILWKQSKKTGGERLENPPHLIQFENAEVVFEPQAPLFLEPFDQCAALGRLAVMDSNRLKMLGKVSSTVLKDHAGKKGEHLAQ
jgi:elongation factor 1-alpha